MLDKGKIFEFLNARLADTDAFAVDVTVSATNDIVIEIDSSTSVDVDFCAELSRDFEAAFPREDDEIGDYSLEVGSAGLTAPFKVAGQWEKNLGKEIELTLKDGRKLRALLESYDNATGKVVVSYERKVKREGVKKPVIERVSEELAPEDIRRAAAYLEF